jgi:ketosteroid isomerase-like protein
MSENTDAINRAYEGFNSGDTDAIAAAFKDDVVWEGPNAEEVPGGGRHEGKDAVLQMLGRIFESWESFSATADELLEEGDTVVVLGHLEGTTKAGNDVKTPHVQIFRMDNGEAERIQALTDSLELGRALEVA